MYGGQSLSKLKFLVILCFYKGGGKGGKEINKRNILCLPLSKFLFFVCSFTESDCPPDEKLPEYKPLGSVIEPFPEMELVL